MDYMDLDVRCSRKCLSTHSLTIYPPWLLPQLLITWQHQEPGPDSRNDAITADNMIGSVISHQLKISRSIGFHERSCFDRIMMLAILLATWIAVGSEISSQPLLINRLPPACWSTFWKSNFKQQLGCGFDITDNKSYFCVLTYAIIYVLIHQIIFRFYLLKYSLFFQVRLY